MKKNAHLLTCDDGESVSVAEMAPLQADQEETDRRVVLDYSRALDHGYDQSKTTSPDSDTFFILLHYARNLNTTVLFDAGSGNRRWLLQC